MKTLPGVIKLIMYMLGPSKKNGVPREGKFQRKYGRAAVTA